MKKYAKIIYTILILTSVLLAFTGCGDFINSEKIGEEKSEEVLKYLDNNDAKGLKNMFCNKAKSSKDLDQQIQSAFSFFEGKTLSHNSPLISGSESADGGKISKLDIGPNISNIVTDADKKYEIKFSSYIVYAEDTDKEGISEISIKSDDGKECKIGDFYLVNPEYR